MEIMQEEVKTVIEKEDVDYRKCADTIHCGNRAGRSEDSHARKEVKLKPFSLPNTLLRPNNNSTLSEYHFGDKRTEVELKIERLKFPVSY